MVPFDLQRTMRFSQGLNLHVYARARLAKVRAVAVGDLRQPPKLRMTSYLKHEIPILQKIELLIKATPAAQEVG